MNNPLVCPACGGKRPAYRTDRKTNFRCQYRRCESCGDLSKTLAWEQSERKLTNDEIELLSMVLPDDVLNGNCTGRYEVFLVCKPL